MNFQSAASSVFRRPLRVFAAAALAACTVMAPASADRHHHGHDRGNFWTGVIAGGIAGVLLDRSVDGPYDRGYYDNGPRFMRTEGAVCRQTYNGDECRIERNIELDMANPGDRAAAYCADQGGVPVFLQRGRWLSYMGCDNR